MIQRWIAPVIVVVAMVCGTHQTLASTLVVSEDMRHDLEVFLELEKRIANADSVQLEQLRKTVDKHLSHPLHPYLVYQWLNRAMKGNVGRVVDDFLTLYAQHHLGASFLSRWLDQRYQQNDKQGFSEWFKNGLSVHHYCQSLWLNRNELSSALLNSEVSALWLSPESLPKSCDPLLRRWQQQGGLTQELVLQRLALVGASGERGLLTYLGNKLASSHKYLAMLWGKVKQSPQAVLTYSNFPLKYPRYEGEIIAYAIEKLAWQNIDKAIIAFEHWQGTNLLTKAQRHTVTKAIALNLALQNRDDALVWMERIPIQHMSLDILRWQVAHLVRQGNWHRALDTVSDASRRFTDDELQYWLARSYEQLDAQHNAVKTLGSLAGRRGYYGFAASAKLSLSPSFEHAPPSIDPQRLHELSETTPYKRVMYLYALNRMLDARREWRDWLPLLSKSDLQHVAVLASDQQWHDLAFQAFSQSGYLNDIERRFPMGYANLFISLGKKHQVPTSFALAIARRESAFRPDAISSKGARGLMQLMPGTANFINKGALPVNSLFEPSINVDLGIEYIAYLQRKWNNEPVLVAASYNAGWQKVLQWLPDDRSIDTDVWIDNIPFKETREYVKAVLTYQQIYEAKLSGNTLLFEKLTTSKIKPYAMEMN